MENPAAKIAKIKHSIPSPAFSNSLSLAPSSSISGSSYRFNHNGPPEERVLIEQHKMHFKSTLDWDQAQNSHLWRSEPDLPKIKQIMGPVLSQIDLTAKHLTIEIFAFGSFNKMYLLTACHGLCSFDNTSRTGNTSFGGDASSSDKNPCPGGAAKIQLLLQLALPIYLWYKTESEAATMEFLRARTTIPILRTYAFSSSVNNPISFKWVLMEKMLGQPYKQLAAQLSVTQKRMVLKAMASYTKELSRLSFGKIGSLYCNWDALKREFYLGPAVDMDFLKVSRSLYQTNRESFSNVQAYFAAFLNLKLQEASVHHLQQRAQCALDLLARMKSGADDDEEKYEEKYEGNLYYEASRTAEACHRFHRIVSGSTPLAKEPIITHLHKPNLNESSIFVDVAFNVTAVYEWDTIVALPEYLTNKSADISPLGPMAARIPNLTDEQVDQILEAKDKVKKPAAAMGRVIKVLAEYMFKVEEDLPGAEKLIEKLERRGILDGAGLARRMCLGAEGRSGGLILCMD
jgi:hypothetical protein